MIKTTLALLLVTVIFAYQKDFTVDDAQLNRVLDEFLDEYSSANENEAKRQHNVTSDEDVTCTMNSGISTCDVSAITSVTGCPGESKLHKVAKDYSSTALATACKKLAVCYKCAYYHDNKAVEADCRQQFFDDGQLSCGCVSGVTDEGRCVSDCAMMLRASQIFSTYTFETDTTEAGKVCTASCVSNFLPGVDLYT